MTLNATDDLAGADNPGVTILSPNGSTITFCSAGLQSGTRLNGTFSCSFTATTLWPQGTYQARVEGVDALNNWNVGGQQFVSFEVINLSGDSGGPVYSSISLSPNSVDVTSSSQTITVTLNVTDDLAGADNPFVTVLKPNGGIAGSCSAGLQSGTRLNGTFSCSFTVV